MNFTKHFYSILNNFLHYRNKTTILNKKIMSNNSKIILDLKNIFLRGVDSVLPEKLITDSVRLEDSEKVVNICGKQYQLRNGCYVIGFGKAVLGMAIKLEQILSLNLISGILSVPVGLLKQNHLNSRLLILEGAKNNLPDEQAESNAKKIVEFITGLNKDALIIVLISGGGSALLPLPKPPLKLEQKTAIIKQLASAGADILEINSIRKQLSQVKGGGLAKVAYPRKVVSLILSDIIGDPIDFIASGPTSLNTDTKTHIQQILDKYNVQNLIPKENLAEIEADVGIPIENGTFAHVDNYIVGNNTKALKAASDLSEELGYNSCILSSKLEGNVTDISSKYIKLVELIISFLNSANNLKDELFPQMQKLFQMNCQSFDIFLQTLSESKCNRRNICLVFGGEPTVLVKGSGKGGRSQQLALQFSLDMAANFGPNSDVILLCAGTDGIDGPTDAAGAIGFAKQIDFAKEQNLNPIEFLNDSNSYEYFTKLNNGEYLVKIGHTGTNVMDLHCLYISVPTIVLKV